MAQPDDGTNSAGLDAPSGSDVPEVMTKWAGEPSDGSGMGGGVSSPTDVNYDPHVKPGLYTEVGATGLAQYGGFVRDEFLQALQGTRGLQVFREMYDNEAVVGALVFAIQMLLRGVKWRVEPPEAATVEDIVAEREADRTKLLTAQHQANQMKLQQVQAGMAAGAAGTKGQPGGPTPAPKAPGPSSPFAQPATSPGLHEPIGSDSGGSNSAATPPTGPTPHEGLPSGAGGGTSDRLTKARGRGLLSRMFKAGSGSMTGSINTTDVDVASPIDPETGEPMEFGQIAPMSPQERKHQELAVFVETCLHDMATPWADFIAQAITMVVFGFALHEIVYKKRSGPNVDDPRQGSRFKDGKVGWADFSGRSQETTFRWEFDDFGHPIGMWQMAPPNFRLRYIPLVKSLLFRTTSAKDNPQGRSILRSAYRSWYFLRRLQEFEAIGVERDTGGMPVAYVPAEYMSKDATPEQKASLDAIKTIVRNLRSNEQAGVVFPAAYDENGNKLFELTLLSPSAGRTRMQTDPVIKRYEQRIAMVSLAEFLFLGMDGNGARALGETKVSLFTTALEAWLNVIADVINTQAIPKLLVLNGEDPAMSPRLTFGELTNVGIQEVAQMITAMAGAGVDLFPDVNLEDHLRSMIGAPPKASTDDL